jgi:SNF2 family DNA or RNA helicase
MGLDMNFTPYPYQQQIIDHILDNPRSAVWAGMGMGKTSASLYALNALTLIDDSKTLVIAPLRVARSTWPDEIKKWSEFNHLTISPIIGSKKQRLAALTKDADIYTINYENITWLVEHLGDNWPFENVIADESTKLKGFRLRQGSKRAQALAKVAHKKVKRFIQLTGTPSPNGLLDLWGQAWFLDHGQRLGNSFKAFTDRWFIPERVGSDAYAIAHRPRANARKEIEDRMRDLCITLDAKDWFDLDDPIVNNIYIDLPAHAQGIYDDMEEDLFTQLNGTDIEAANAAVKSAKCLQIASGILYDEDGNWTEIHDEKIQVLDEIINESGGTPILVAYHFKADLERLRKAFPQGRILDSNPKTLLDWNSGKIPLLFAHPASAGHGLNLQDGGNILVFFGHWWNLEEYQQIIERIGPTRQKQAGHDRPVFIHHILTRGTVDEVVMARRQSKRQVQDLLLEAMKRKQQ